MADVPIHSSRIGRGMTFPRRTSHALLYRTQTLSSHIGSDTLSVSAILRETSDETSY